MLSGKPTSTLESAVSVLNVRSISPNLYRLDDKCSPPLERVYRELRMIVVYHIHSRPRAEQVISLVCEYPMQGEFFMMPFILKSKEEKINDCI